MAFHVGWVSEVCEHTCGVSGRKTGQQPPGARLAVLQAQPESPQRLPRALCVHGRAP